MAEVECRRVDVVFGSKPERALELIDRGKTRDEILAETGHVVGVCDASIAIEQGEICVLMGLSGSGKSTLLRCVNGLNRASRGEVLIADEGGAVDVGRCSPATLRRLRTRRIAMVFQQFALFPWRTVKDNVGFGLEIRGLARAQREQIVDRMLRLVGLEQWRDKHAHELSGGMQQRVGLARAFATDADILLMDEPFSALDPLIRSRLQDELLTFQHQLKKTIIFVSHDLDEAMKLGSHIAIMEGGRIVQYGSPEAIVLNPASRYVADFVAHMNPLNVLRGASLMTPLDGIVRRGEELWLDPAGRARLTLAADGAAAGALIASRATPIVAWRPNQPLAELAAGALVSAPAEITLKTALELRHRTGNPVVLVNDHKVVGVIGDDEIYRGILRQTELAQAPPAAER
jgi:glycine betaine/proline transport system ATP-binding protein